MVSPAKCTAEHPFYVIEDGFVPAWDLNISDDILLSSGNYATIESIWIEQLSEPETTYNFEVADFHTYYVGEQGVLVHNTCWEWGQGSYDSPETSLARHASKHGGELGLKPTDTKGYLKKAIDLADTVVQRGVKAGAFVEGATANIRAYTYAGKTIWMDKANKIIVSFFKL